MRLPPPPPPGTAPAAGFEDLPTIFTVLRRLGLELKQQEATVPVYTVEHIEAPAAGQAARLARLKELAESGVYTLRLTSNTT